MRQRCEDRQVAGLEHISEDRSLGDITGDTGRRCRVSQEAGQQRWMGWRGVGYLRKGRESQRKRRM